MKIVNVKKRIRDRVWCRGYSNVFNCVQYSTLNRVRDRGQYSTLNRVRDRVQNRIQYIK